jgi:ATP-dependent Zn protease
MDGYSGREGVIVLPATNTIVPSGQALGVTYQRPQTDRYNYPEAYLRARIAGTLGGRAAEELVYGTRTTGAAHHHERHGDAIRLWRQHRRALDALVNALLERETLGELEILETTGLPTAPALQNMPQEQTNEDG